MDTKLVEEAIRKAIKAGAAQARPILCCRPVTMWTLNAFRRTLKSNLKSLRTMLQT